MNPETSRIRDALLAARTAPGKWEGRLSSSALATATAAFALRLAGRDTPARRGLQWIDTHRNRDGTWGDTPDSPGNPTATLLCRCALGEENTPPAETARSVLESYGCDRTFSVPILAMMLLSRGTDRDWTHLPQLPFEAALLPRSLYRRLRVPVVSYALPALIAAGILRHVKRPVRFAAWRTRLIRPALAVLQRIQPESGGFLEAAPLSAFVLMCLAGSGLRDHPVARSATRFLEKTQREDGSWPIDVNLSTWVTSLAIRALGTDLPPDDAIAARDHLLALQWKTEHPFTLAAPGGWSWTDLPGGVPDADDTAAALIALRQLGCDPLPAQQAIKWLIDLQNRDGGVPTFCRGWGKLPFDRSAPDITAHAVRAFSAWRGTLPPQLERRASRFIRDALRYLQRNQREDGTWIPLWFGSQSRPGLDNPVYGTVRVLEALNVVDEREFPFVLPMRERGMKALLDLRNADGSWGDSIEETALAAGITGIGRDRLVEMTAGCIRFPPSPIGLYFAKLWYAEDLYPLIFTLEALRAEFQLPA